MLLGYLLLLPPLPILPDLAKNTPWSLDEGRKEFSSRVLKKFPIGTDEALLIKSLKQQNFTVDENIKKAWFSKGKFTCMLRWSVDWEVNASDKIKIINTIYDMSCL